jgi:hypothetical protein
MIKLAGSWYIGTQNGETLKDLLIPSTCGLAAFIHSKGSFGRVGN